MHHFPHGAVGVGFQHMYHLGARSITWERSSEFSVAVYFVLFLLSLYVVLEEHEHVLAMTPVLLM